MAWPWIRFVGTLLAAAPHIAGDASHNMTVPQRRLQSDGPWRVILPFAHPELCAPQNCFLRIPASAFPPQMMAHESREEVENLGTRYTEIATAVKKLGASPITGGLEFRSFVNYCRHVGNANAETHDSITAFDPILDTGEYSCDLSQMQFTVTGNPGPSPACLVWMHIFKVFLHYEEGVTWETVSLYTHGLPSGWCATAQPCGEDCCPEENRCWPGCAHVVETAQAGLEDEWCGPWPGCAAYDPPFGASSAAALTLGNIAIFFTCGCLVAVGFLRVMSGYKRRRGARYQKVPVMEGAELAVDFGDDETENQAGKETVVPTSG